MGWWSVAMTALLWMAGRSTWGQPYVTKLGKNNSVSMGMAARYVAANKWNHISQIKMEDTLWVTQPFLYSNATLRILHFTFLHIGGRCVFACFLLGLIILRGSFQLVIFYDCMCWFLFFWWKMVWDWFAAFSGPADLSDISWAQESLREVLQERQCSLTTMAGK